MDEKMQELNNKKMEGLKEIKDRYNNLCVQVKIDAR